MDYCGNPIASGRVVCPKPRRAGLSNDFTNNSLGFHLRSETDVLDSKPCAELFDLILCKVDFEAERCGAVSSSPPFFFGSPPRRASNPIAQDAHFGTQRPTYICSSPADSALLPSATRARSEFAMKQAAIRVEGFHCGSSRIAME